MIPLGLQLYTLRDALANDMAGTLRRVAAIGYRHVEVSRLGDLSATKYRQQLDAAGLTAGSVMFPLAEFETKPEAIATACTTLGSRYAVMPWSPVNQQPTRAGFEKLGEALANAAAKLKPAGIRVCYHNHAEEIRTYEGQTGLEWILNAGSDVYSQLDVYWSHIGGVDPVTMMKRLGKRISLLHLKDATPQGRFAPVGTGVLNWPAIQAAIPSTAAGWAFVEQDTCDGDPFECVQQSLDYLVGQKF